MERDAQRVAALLTLLIFGGAALALVGAEAEPDIWGRIAYARDALARGQWIWHSDVYSYLVPGARWVDHEWGFSWIAYAVFRLGGWAAIRLLRVVLMGTAGILCLKGLGDSPGALRLRPALAFVLALPLALGFIGPRPQAFSFLFFAWMCFCFARSWTHPSWWMVLGVLPMPLWVNIHGGFAAGMGVAAVWCAARLPGAVSRRSTPELAALGACLAWCAASAFLSPWGADYLAFIVRTGTMARPYVEEWNPPKFPGPHFFLGVALALISATAWFSRPRRWPDLAVLAVLIVETFLHRRHLTFLAIGAAVFAFPAAARLWERWRPPAAAEESRALRNLLRGTAATLALATLAVLALTASKLRAPPPHEPNFPVAALAYLESRGQGGVLVDFNWAQYVISEAWPKLQVAVDGRYEEVYPPDVLEEYFAWHYGLDGWAKLPADPRSRYALVETGSSRDERLRAMPAQWRRVYEDALASVFVKSVGGP